MVHGAKAQRIQLSRLFRSPCWAEHWLAPRVGQQWSQVWTAVVALADRRTYAGYITRAMVREVVALTAQSVEYRAFVVVDGILRPCFRHLLDPDSNHTEIHQIRGVWYRICSLPEFGEYLMTSLSPRELERMRSRLDEAGAEAASPLVRKACQPVSLPVR